MATTLAAQLSQVAAKSTNALNLKAQKIAHSKSLIFDATVAASQDFDTLYTVCAEGFQELCLLDPRFKPFTRSIFSEHSKAEDRTQMTQRENEELDRALEDFLGLLGGRLLLKPAVKAIEWLVRRFRVHEYNTAFLLLTFLPYHTAPIFTTLLSVLPPEIPPTFKFLHPYIRSLTNPARHAVVYAAINSQAFATALNSHVISLCRSRHHHHAVLSFWAGIMTEAVSGMLDRARSGRSTVQRQAEEDVLLRILPVLNEGLAMKKVPELRLGCYMILTVLAAKADLEGRVLNGMMEAVVGGWNMDTLDAGLTCLAILAQTRDSTRLPPSIVKGVLKIEGLSGYLIALHQRYRVDKLALALALGAVTRLGRAGVAQTCAFLESTLTSQILSDSQRAVTLKSLFLEAQTLDLGVNGGTSTGRELADLLVRLSAAPTLTEPMRKAIEQSGVEVDLLEMKLQTVIRSSQPTIDGPAVDSEMHDIAPTNGFQGQVETLLVILRERSVEDPSFLSHKASAVFGPLSETFIASASTPAHLVEVLDLPVLCKERALDESLFYSFFMRIWCGPYPTLARSAALAAVEAHLSSAAVRPIDLQALLPYILAALADTSEKVRRSAAGVIVALSRLQARAGAKNQATKGARPWGFEDIYGQEATADVKWMSTEETARFIDNALLPGVEECILDDQRVGSLLEATLRASTVVGQSSKADTTGLKSSQRMALLSFLSSHILATPLYTVKFRLLTMLNRVPKVGGASRTRSLFPVLQRWISLDAETLENSCRAEHISLDDLEHQVVAIVTAGDREGLKLLQEIMKGEHQPTRPTLMGAAYERLRHIWSSLKPDFQVSVARFLMDIAFDAAQGSDTRHQDAIDTLRSVQLTSRVMVCFVEDLHSIAELPEKPAASKRRRTNRHEKVDISSQDSTFASIVIKRMTLVLELVESSQSDGRHSLLRGLFQTLGDLQRLKVHVGSELAYLHGLLLDSLLKIIDGYKDSEDLTLDRAAIRADLLVDSIRSTGNPQVQIAALLLVASLADVAPDLVLHSVMPIFTFMGPTVLRQDDEFSVHVINQAIKQVIPPLVGSLRKQNQDPVAGTAELLLSFVAAYEHIPSHRRLELFTSLVRTLGEQDFLFALLAMLADRYANDAEVQVFTATLTAQFSPETLLSTARKCMDLAIDAMRSQRSLSGILLSIGQTEHGTPVTAASNVLRLVKEILSAKRLVSRIGDAAEQQKGGPLVSTENFSTLLEHLLDFASGVKSERELYAACGEVLESLLHLLPTPDFIQSIETLLERPDEKLRCKALKAFEIRLRSEKQGEKSAAASILAFLPRVASIIEGPSSMVLKHSAISCVDHILERYGKKDIDAVAAAAHTIAGPHGLRHDDDRLRVLSLLCLTSCVEILQAGIIPLLPHTVPQALGYLAASLEEGSGNEKIHDAVFSFLGAFLLYVPWMITGTHLDDILRLCHKSAQARLGEVADESRLQVLRLIPNHLDVKDCFGALDRNWSSAIETGPTALKEHLDVLGIAVERHPKAAIVKHAQVLGSILLKILDLRRTIASDGADAFATMEVVEVEKVANDVAINIILKMNDTTFRPIFSQVIERAGGRQSKKDTRTRTLRLTSLYTFLYTFFDTLKSIVTSYSSYVIDLAIEVLDNVRPRDKDAKALWTVVTRTLSKSFEHDRDDFWQSPSHFGAVAPTLLSQLGKASFLPVAEVVIPAITELAAAVDSGEQHKELNAAILKHLRSPDAQVRLAAVLCEEALTDRLGEEWLALLPEMLPFISELQEDDDEGVERQTHRWIVKMEGVLGESLESMLQ